MNLVQINKVKSFEDILGQLTKLEKDLASAKLHQFNLFNTAYRIVTSNIKEAAEDNYFSNPKTVEQFTARFAHYYFQALNQTITSSKELPPAWKLLNKAKVNAPDFIYLLLGANAHINNDLPLVLVEMSVKVKGQNLLDDVYKVDKILVKSGREIIGEFKERNRLLNFLKNHLVFFYYPIVMRIILHWRNKAWKDSQLIKEMGIQQSNYQKFSVKTAKRLLWLA